MSIRPHIIRAGKWLAGLIGVSLFFLALFFGWMQTKTGKEQIAAFLTTALSSKDTQIEIIGIEGFIPFDMFLHRFTVRDTYGKWLTIEDITFRCSPFSAFIQGRIKINEIRVGSLHIHRFPLKTKKDQTVEFKLPLWTGILPPVILERFLISRLVLEKAIAVQSAAFTLDGQIKGLDPLTGISASLRIHRIDGRKGYGELTFGLKGEEQILYLNGNLEEEKDGFLCSLFGFREAGPLAISLQGEGPIKAWRGKCLARAEGIGDFECRISARAYPEFILTTEGKLRVVPSLLPEGTEALLGEESQFLIIVGYQPKKLLSIKHLKWRTNSADFQLRGDFFLREKHWKGSFALETQELIFPEESMGRKLSGRLLLKGIFSGPVLKPEATLDFLLQEAQFSDFSLSRFQGQIQLQLLGPLSYPFQGLHVKGKGSASGLAHQTLPAFPVSKLDWTGAMDVLPDGTISLEKLRLTEENLSLGISGRLDRAGPRILAEASFDVPNLQKLFRNLNNRVSGKTHFNLTLEWDGGSREISSRIEGKLFGLQQNDPPLTSLFGSEIEYSVTLKLSAGKELKISNFHLSSPVAEIAGNASLLLPGKEVKGYWKLYRSELSLLSPHIGKKIKGAIEMEGEIGGYLSAPTLMAKATGRDIEIEEFVHFQQVEAVIRADCSKKKLQGYTQIVLTQSGYKVHAAGKYILDGKQLKFSDVLMTAPGTKVTGEVNVNLNNRLAKGFLQGNSGDLSFLTPFLREDVAGSGAFKAYFKPGKAGQDVILELQGEEVLTNFGEVEKITLATSIHNLFGQMETSGEMVAQTSQRGSLTFKTINLSFRYQEKTLNFQSKAKGQYGKDFEINARGEVNFFPGGQKVKLKILEGSYGSHKIALSQPATVLHSKDGFVFEAFTIQTGTGSFTAAGALRSKALNCIFQVQNFPLDVLSFRSLPDLTGSVAGKIRVAGELDHPDITLNLKLTEVLLEEKSYKKIPPATLSITGNISRGYFRSKFSVENLTEKPIEAALSFPMIFSLSPFSFFVPPHANLEGKLRGEVNLAHLLAVFPSENQTFDGLVRIDFNLAGSVEAPEIEGTGSIERATYENAKIGIILKDFQAEITAKGRRVFLKQARATDGEGHVVKVDGWFDMEYSRGFPLQIVFHLDEVTFVRLDALTANASGDLELSGSFTDMVLEGKLTVKTAKLRIPDRKSPEIDELEVIEINLPDQEMTSPSTPKPSGNHRLRLELEFDSPGRLFVRGRGLDSEWKGKFLITGNPAEITTDGAFSVVRGYFNLFNKRFTLTQGSITLDGTFPQSLSLNVRAEKKLSDMIACVNLTGELSAPRVSLESDPPLPTDEILSRLLFGRSAADVTPVQALQLAQAINSLAGRDFGVLGFMDRTRKLLRVDQLSVEQSGERNSETSVTVGKYLKEDMYVEFDKGMGTESDKISVEVEITPNLTVESEAGTDARGGIGVNWKLDY
ncbi:MAG: translocation/assembly module TamB domain-containing protein [Pseudomonadota bacterium]